MMTKIILLTLWTYYSATRYRRPCRPPHYLPPTVAAALLRLHRPRNAAGLVTSCIYLIVSTTSRSYPRGNIEIITSLLRMIVTTDTAPPPPLLPSSSHPRRRAVLPFFPPWQTATPVANLHQPQPPRPQQRWQRHAPPPTSLRLPCHRANVPQAGLWVGQRDGGPMPRSCHHGFVDDAGMLLLLVLGQRWLGTEQGNVSSLTGALITWVDVGVCYCVISQKCSPLDAYA